MEGLHSFLDVAKDSKYTYNNGIIHMILSWDSVEETLCLIENGADCSITDHNGKSVLFSNGISDNIKY
jgi:hypothetical protein